MGISKALQAIAASTPAPSPSTHAPPSLRPCALRNSPRGLSARPPSVFLRISVFPFLAVSPPRLLPPPNLRPRSPGLETPRRSPGHNGVFHGFLRTLHYREGNTGVCLSSAHEKERGFDRGSYFFLIYNPEAPCSRPRRPRAGAAEHVSRRRGFA